MMFPHRNFHKYTWTSPDGKIHNQIDHIFIDRRWYSSILDVRLFRTAICDTDHHFMVAKVKESLAVSNQTTQKFDVEKFNIRKFSELEVRKQYQSRISKRFAALENLNNSEDINRVGRILKRMSKHQLKRVWVSMNGSSITCVLKDVHSF